MIRQPSSHADLFAWWNCAISGGSPPTYDGLPECGFYKRRLIRKGPWVPVRIYVDRDIDPMTGELTRDEKLRCDVEGLDGGNPADHWTYLKPITRNEYEHLVDYRLRDSRMANARSPFDLSDQPTLPQGMNYA